MHVEPKSSFKAKVSTSNHKTTGERFFGKKYDWKCTYCNMKGGKCWILHHELNPKFDIEDMTIKDGKGFAPKAFHITDFSVDGMANFSSNPNSLINKFAAFLQKKKKKGEALRMRRQSQKIELRC